MLNGDLPEQPSLAPPILPADELLAASEGYLVAFRSAPPSLVEAAAAWLDEIRPPQWALEWSLPSWLGETFQLSPAARRSLVLSNVIGLAYIRLQDALADGELRRLDPALAPLLSTLLYQRWMQTYRGLCDVPLFWLHFDACMAEWIAATAIANESPAHAFREYEGADYLRLAHRGAPLKVCVVAACLLTGREEDLPTLVDAIDHLLVGAVLLDHAHDWPADLAAGRYNAFVAYASSLPQTPQHRDANMRAVQGELCLGKAARPYFQIAQQQLQVARELAEPAGCTGLQQYLLWLDEQTSACSERLASSAAALLDHTVRYLTGGF